MEGKKVHLREQLVYKGTISETKECKEKGTLGFAVICDGRTRCLFVEPTDSVFIGR
jgi:hypothetical protein